MVRDISPYKRDIIAVERPPIGISHRNRLPSDHRLTTRAQFVRLCSPNFSPKTQPPPLLHSLALSKFVLTSSGEQTAMSAQSKILLTGATGYIGLYNLRQISEYLSNSNRRNNLNDSSRIAKRCPPRRNYHVSRPRRR